MEENKEKNKKDPAPVLHTAPSPHLSNTSFTSRWMMVDVLIGLAPVLIVSFIYFKHYALLQLTICVATCMITEEILSQLQGKGTTVTDCSAAVTGIILGLSLPWSAPWYVGVIGSVFAISLGKVVFGGLGFNLFNPAMVGRAFIMLSFAKSMGANAYAHSGQALKFLTEATPLSLAKAGGETLPSTMDLFLGNQNGSLGEISALACLIGGLYLCVRRSASWEIPVGVIGSVAVLATIASAMGLSTMGVEQHLTSGALFFGAFYIATDPVTSPITPKGKFLFGIGIGCLTLLLRLFSSYPEGVMFAVLIMNSLVPIINKYTIPRPLGLMKKA